MTAPLNHLWSDSMADFGMQAALDAERLRDLHADYGPAERAEGLWIEPQGRRDQGWPARRCSPELRVIDRLPEEFDEDDRREAMSPGEACFLVVAYCLSTCFVVWLAVNLLSTWS